LKVVTFDQHREQLDLTLPLRRALCENGEFVHYKDNPIHVIGWAERFLFSKVQLDLPLSRLSGGEQSRVLIARLMLRPADILLLDEPTNDLDINSLEVLETSMMEFSGALVLVTHDRYLLDRVSRRLLSLDGRGHAAYYADLAQWEDAQTGNDDILAKPATPAQNAAVPANKKSPFTAKDEKELKNVEALMRAADVTCQNAQKALSDPSVATNADELIVRQKAFEAAQKQVDHLLQRWIEIDSRRNR